MRFVAAVVLFALTVAAFTLVAKYNHQSVEEELVRLASASLEEAGYSGVVVSFDHLQGNVDGFVDSEEEKAAVVALLREKVPTAYWPEVEETDLVIRPTIPPLIEIERMAGSDTVRLTGEISASEDANRMLLGARLHSLEGVKAVDNRITLDSKRLPFEKTAEMASLAANLVSNSEDASISLKEGKLAISGKVANDGLKTNLLELSESIAPGAVSEQIEVAEPTSFRSPSQLKVTRNRFGIILTGKIGSEASRTKLLHAFAGLPGQEKVTDRLEVSEIISPAVWEDHSDVLIPAMLKHFEGEMTAEFSHDQIRLEGVVANQAATNGILAGFRPLKKKQPSLEILTNITIDEEESKNAEPVRLHASLEGELWTITGLVRDASFFQRIEEEVEKVRPELSVKNALEENSNIIPADWLQKLPELFAELSSRLEKGVVSIEGKRVSLEGETVAATDPALLQNVAINTVPAEYSVENTLAHIDQPFPSPALLPEVRAKLSEQLKQLPVYFDSGSEIVKNDEKEKIDSIVAAINEAGAAVELVVTGFADNVGNAEYNRELSLRRANAVVALLSAKGVATENITTESKGEDVSGVARSERWKSRRVEVSIAPSNQSPQPEEE